MSEQTGGLPVAPVGLPDGWASRSVEDCISTRAFERRASIPKSAYVSSGTYPVVDQGQSLIAGFTNDETAIHRGDLPLILFGDHTRAVKYIDFPFATGADGTKLMRAASGLDSRYLYFALLNLKLPSRGYNRHFGLLCQETIDVPADEMEQRAIAGVLSKLQAAVELQDQIVTTLNDLKSATMAKLFREGLRGEPLKKTEIGEIPESWEVRPLGSLLREPLRNGMSAAAAADGVGIRTLTLTAVTGRRFTPENTKVTIASAQRVADLWLRSGDIFVERANTREMVGLAALYRGPDNFAIFPDLLIRVRSRQEEIKPEVLVEWLLQPWCRAYFSSHSRGAATSMPKIDHRVLGEVLVPLPGQIEADGIARVIRALDDRTNSAVVRLGLTRSTFATMLELLMTGRCRLRVQHGGDQP